MEFQVKKQKLVSNLAGSLTSFPVLKTQQNTSVWPSPRQKLLFTFFSIAVAFHKFASVQTRPKYHLFKLKVS